MALGLWVLATGSQQLPQNLNGEDAKSLLRLNEIPAQELESKAKAKGLWHPNQNGTVPSAGDLVTFSPDGDSCLPHVGVVTGVNNKDGTVHVRSEAKANLPGNAVDEEFTLKTSDISAPANQINR